VFVSMGKGSISSSCSENEDYDTKTYNLTEDLHLCEVIRRGIYGKSWLCYCLQAGITQGVPCTASIIVILRFTI
jgi:hypothetical protein